MKRLLSLIAASATLALCSCQSTSTMKSDCCAKPGASCCKTGAACCKTAAAKPAECAACAADAKHKH